MTTGEVIRKLRIKNGYTQTELAEKLGITLSTIQKYEGGAIQNLKIETLRDLCNIFYVPPVAFVFPKIEEVNQKIMIKWLLSEYGILNDAWSDKVIAYIEDLRGNQAYKGSRWLNMVQD